MLSFWNCFVDVWRSPGGGGGLLECLDAPSYCMKARIYGFVVREHLDCLEKGMIQMRQWMQQGVVMVVLICVRWDVGRSRRW